MIDKLSKGRLLNSGRPFFLPIFLVFFKKNTNFAPETLNT